MYYTFEHIDDAVNFGRSLGIKFMIGIQNVEVVMAMNELGTMIDDLQKQGDYAIEKWAR